MPRRLTLTGCILLVGACMAPCVMAGDSPGGSEETARVLDAVRDKAMARSRLLRNCEYTYIAETVVTYAKDNLPQSEEWNPEVRGKEVANWLTTRTVHVIYDGEILYVEDRLLTNAASLKDGSGYVHDAHMPRREQFWLGRNGTGIRSNHLVRFDGDAFYTALVTTSSLQMELRYIVLRVIWRHFESQLDSGRGNWRDRDSGQSLVRVRAVSNDTTLIETLPRPGTGSEGSSRPVRCGPVVEYDNTTSDQLRAYGVMLHGDGREELILQVEYTWDEMDGFRFARTVSLPWKREGETDSSSQIYRMEADPIFNGPVSRIPAPRIGITHRDLRTTEGMLLKSDDEPGYGEEIPRSVLVD